MYLKYPVLDMIQRIDLRCGSFGSMIRFWILVKKRNIRFRIKIAVYFGHYEAFQEWIFPLKIRIRILVKKRLPILAV